MDTYSLSIKDLPLEELENFLKLWRSMFQNLKYYQAEVWSNKLYRVSSILTCNSNWHKIDFLSQIVSFCFMLFLKWRTLCMTMHIEALHRDAYTSSSQEDMFMVHQILWVMSHGTVHLSAFYHIFAFMWRVRAC